MGIFKDTTFEGLFIKFIAFIISLLNTNKSSFEVKNFDGRNKEKFDEIKEKMEGIY